MLGRRSNLLSLGLLGLACVTGALGSGSVIACGGGSEDDATAAQGETAMDKADWLEKAASLLRNGEGIGPHDDVAALMAMEKDAIVDTFMKDPRFGDMVLAFNMYYLGRSVTQLKQVGPGGKANYDPMVLALPQALASANSVVKGGNYFDLYSASPPFLLMNKGPGAFGFTPDGGSAQTPRQRAAGAFDLALAAFSSGKQQGCSTFQQSFGLTVQDLYYSGFTIAYELYNRWLGANTTGDPDKVDCVSPQLTADQVADQVRHLKGTIDGIYAAIEAAPDVITSVGDFVRIDMNVEGSAPLVAPLTSLGFWSQLPSTATNYHRRRASYILKTYFCDDLTPINLAVTTAQDAGGHGDEVHASNPTCQACHYRLDPIGALFRNIGAQGQDFTGQNQIFFDDGRTFNGPDYDKYLSQWRNDDGTFRAGYYVIGPDGKPQRDTSWLDSDGDTISALWSYLPRSEVVRSCLTRKLAEYVLGPKQVYDREWLKQISKKLKNDSHSGEAFKGVVKALVLSKTFSTQDPRAGICYDAPTNAAAQRPPCAVAHVVDNNCRDCHSSVLARGHLDFTSWKQLDDGTFTWPHVDEQGVQLSAKASYAMILERISSTDPQKAMPFQRALSEEDSTAFKNWLNENLH